MTTEILETFERESDSQRKEGKTLKQSVKNHMKEVDEFRQMLKEIKTISKGVHSIGLKNAEKAVESGMKEAEQKMREAKEKCKQLLRRNEQIRDKLEKTSTERKKAIKHAEAISHISSSKIKPFAIKVAAALNSDINRIDKTKVFLNEARSELEEGIKST